MLDALEGLPLAAELEEGLALEVEEPLLGDEGAGGDVAAGDDAGDGAAELETLGYLRQGDTITLAPDRLVHDAKQKVLSLAATVRPGRPATDLRAPGRDVAASLGAQLWNLRMGGFITPYEEQIGRAIAGVITGGDVPGGTVVTEQWFLDLEREAFLALCGEKKTLERVQHMLKTGKPLRN